MDRADITKQKIEKAALHLFLQKGVDGTSMRDVVKEAGYSLGAFYNHYSSKEELAWALFSDAWYTMGREMRERIRAARALDEQLLAITNYMFEFFDKSPDLVGYAFLSRHRYIWRVNVRSPNPHLVVRFLITTAMAHGEVRKMDPEIATQVVMGVVIQMIDAKILNLLKGPLQARAAAVADTLGRMLRF